MTRGVNNYPLTSITVTFDNRHRAVNVVNGKTVAFPFVAWTTRGKKTQGFGRNACSVRERERQSERIIVATGTHGTPDPALPSPSLSINSRFTSVSLTRVQHSRTARHSPSYPSHGCPPRVRAYPGRGSRVNTDGQKRRRAIFESRLILTYNSYWISLITSNVCHTVSLLKNMSREAHEKNMETQVKRLLKRQLKEEKKKLENLRRQRNVLLNDKNVDVLNRLMHTLKLLENNQILFHTLMAINDVTIKAQINQLQVEFVNILQEIKDLHKNLQELFR
ncbi:hypothetical protein ALC56_04256 [Trachymyrmex septentrionalis]|uniref:Uncharacterized protein n=1 Tax=Trachymyrmex septentrionalis TaxID=34720 RepID=A0A195FKB0_9HYME|nr:hypothetical protein ALC56_04256 [Trachymyrmex septentrionalis]